MISSAASGLSAFWLSPWLVDLSRTQFAVTAMFHFLFVPLTLGLSWILVIMEALYLKTGKPVYKDMVRFWGKLFAINFAMGVVTGITLEFEFGQNWAYFSRFIGDTFGSALAIEGITAFMTEATMFGLFFFTWDKVSKKTHFWITAILALGTNLSIVNILVANSWMQHPVFSYLDYQTMTMHLTNLAGIYTHELAQIRVGHVVFAGTLTGSIFVLGISAFYLLKKRDTGFAMRSMAVAIGFGICSVIAVAFMGDANGLAVSKDEPMKMAAIEAQWTTQKAPAAWYVIGFPDQAQQNNKAVIAIPYALSLIADHNLTGTVTGVKELEALDVIKIQEGYIAYQALEQLRENQFATQQARLQAQTAFDQYRNVVGYGMLLAHQMQLTGATVPTPELIAQTAKDSVPEVSVLFWAFRIMVGCWGLLVLVFTLSLIFLLRGTLAKQRWLLRLSLYAIPLPWIAAESGWVIAEVGRQPWVVKGILPTFFGVSSLSWQTVAFSLSGFAVLYFILFVVEMFLMFKYARLGPSSLGEGRYHFETHQKQGE